MLKNLPNSVDVAVIGAGPAGAACALALRRHHGLSVALLDKAPCPEFRVGETAVPDVGPLLDGLGGGWILHHKRHLKAQGTCAAWGSSQLNYRDYFSDARGCGWHLDRPHFDKSLVEAAKSAGVAVARGVAVSCRRRGAGWSLEGRRKNGERGDLTAKLIVDASGRSAAIARGQGARAVRVDRLAGVAAVLPPQEKPSPPIPWSSPFPMGGGMPPPFPGQTCGGDGDE